MDAALRWGSAAGDAYDEGQYDVASADANKCLASGPWASIEAEEILAMCDNAEGKSDEAFQLYTKLVVMQGGNEPRDLLPYALMLLQRGRWKDAVDAYTEALPFDGTGLMHGNDLLADESDFSYDHPQPSILEADIHVAYGIELDENWPFRGKSQTDKGLAEFEKALALNPNSPIAKLEFAEGLRECGLPKESAVKFQDIAGEYTGDIHEAAVYGESVAERTVVQPVK